MKTVPLSLLAHWAGGELQGEDIVIAHCYVERRLRPLNLYLKDLFWCLKSRRIRRLRT